jgi:formiminotetrahydrofolate cyclodeaminase
LAFTRLSRAYRLPKDGEEAAIGRRKEIHEALLDAMRPPERVVADCRRAMELLPPLAEAANPNLLSDVEVAAIMLAAAARAALVNLRVNARQLADGEVGETEAGAARRLAEVEELSEKTLALINERRA